MKRFFALLLVFMLCTGCALADTVGLARVTGGNLHLRQAADSSAQIVKTYSDGTNVMVLGEEGENWYHVTTRDGKEGYMMKKYLEMVRSFSKWSSGTVCPAGRSDIPIYYDVNLTTSAGVIEGGQKVDVLDRLSKSYLIHIENKVCYIPTEYIDMLSPAAAAVTYTLPQEPVHEVGSSHVSASWTDTVFFNVNYPVLDAEEADKVISDWANEVQSECKKLSATPAPAVTPAPEEAPIGEPTAAPVSAGEETGQAEMNMVWESFLPCSDCAGVVLFAEYDSAENAFTAVTAGTVDRKTGKWMTGLDLVPAESREKILALMKERILLLAPDETVELTEDALTLAAMTKDGVRFFFNPGDVLPVVYGVVAVTVPYKQAAGCLAVEVTDTMLANAEPEYVYVRTVDYTRPMVALTFDDGPSENTGKILDILAKYDARATFCVTGNQIEMFPKVLQREVAEGHEIATHTVGHKNLVKLNENNVQKQIMNVVTTVRDMTGYEIRFLRPPYGNVNSTVRKVCRNNGLIIATWELDSKDWANRSRSKIISNIKSQVTNGTIILCHDLYDFTAEAMETVIPWLIDQGYQLVTLTELFQYHKDFSSGAMNGVVYSHLNVDNLVSPLQ